MDAGPISLTYRSYALGLLLAMVVAGLLCFICGRYVVNDMATAEG